MKTSAHKKVRVRASHNKPATKAPPSKEPRLGKGDLQYFNSRLLFLKDEAAEELQNLGESTMPLTVAIDEQPGEITASEQTILMIEHQRRLIGFLDAALERILEGSYGRCVSCGTIIERGRLEAIPYTQHCLRCKSA